MANLVVRYSDSASILTERVRLSKVCFLMGTPQHTNIGDRAIAYAEIEFLKDRVGGLIVEVPFGVDIRKIDIKESDTVVLHGGGNLGDIWIEEENYRRKIIKKYSNNRIILMPQTMYFESKDELAESVRVYSSCKNLTMIAREETTYNEMKRSFKSTNIALIPDIVMYLGMKKTFKTTKRDYALFVTRDDKERVISEDYIYRAIKKLTADKGVENIVFSDMHVDEISANHNSHEFIVEHKLNQFKGAKIVITDRLHGMIFALLTGTPCVVFGSKTHKTYGVYEWIRKLGHDKFIKLCRDVEEIEGLIDEVSLSRKYVYKRSSLEAMWRNLENLFSGDRQ